MCFGFKNCNLGCRYLILVLICMLSVYGTSMTVGYELSLMMIEHMHVFLFW